MDSQASMVVLEGEKVLLRPLEPGDYRTVHRWRTDPSLLYLWSHSRRLIGFGEFDAEISRLLKTSVDMWMMMVSKADSQSVGFVYNYDTSIIDGYTFLTMFVAPDLHSRGLGTAAGALFIDYLMSYFPLRKVYADIYEFNTHSLAFVKAHNFAEEGHFPSHRFFGGEYHGLYRFALYRDCWYQNRPAYVQRGLLP